LPFFVLASQRTGSTALVKALASHQDVDCLGELLGGRQTAGWFRDLLDRLDPRFRDPSYRGANTRRFVEAAISVSPKPHVDFKLMLNHDRDVRDSLLADSKWKCVLLHRENVLAAYASWLLAKATHAGHQRAGDAPVLPLVRFDRDGFERWRRRYERRYAEMEGFEGLAVEYTDVAAGSGVEAVLSYIGADPDLGWQFQTQKRGSLSIVQRFANEPTVRDYLDEIGKPDWAVEEIAP